MAVLNEDSLAAAADVATDAAAHRAAAVAAVHGRGGGRATEPPLKRDGLKKEVLFDQRWE